MIIELRTRIIFIVSLVALFMVGGHFMDIGDIVGTGSLTNGFFEISAMKVYHIGYYTMYTTFMTIIILYVDLMLKYHKENG